MTPEEIIQQQLDMQGPPAAFEIINALATYGYEIVAKSNRRCTCPLGINDPTQTTCERHRA